MGQTVGVLKNSDNEYSLEAYLIEDFDIMHTNMGDIINIVKGKVVEKTDDFITLETEDKKIKFIYFKDDSLRISSQITAYYITRDDNNVLAFFTDDANHINFKVSKISRNDSGYMILVGKDDNDNEFSIKVGDSAIIKLNLSQIKVDDTLSIYSNDLIDDSINEFDAKFISK